MTIKKDKINDSNEEDNNEKQNEKDNDVISIRKNTIFKYGLIIVVILGISVASLLLYSFVGEEKDTSTDYKDFMPQDTEFITYTDSEFVNVQGTSDALGKTTIGDFTRSDNFESGIAISNMPSGLAIATSFGFISKGDWSNKKIIDIVNNRDYLENIEEYSIDDKNIIVVSDDNTGISTHFTVIDNYMISATSEERLNSILNAYNNDKNIRGDIEEKFNNNMENNHNFFIIMNYKGQINHLIDQDSSYYLLSRNMNKTNIKADVQSGNIVLDSEIILSNEASTDAVVRDLKRIRNYIGLQKDSLRMIGADINIESSERTINIDGELSRNEFNELFGSIS